MRDVKAHVTSAIIHNRKTLQQNNVKLDLDSGIHNFTGIKVNHDSDVSLATIELSTLSYFLKKIFYLEEF